MHTELHHLYIFYARYPFPFQFMGHVHAESIEILKNSHVGTAKTRKSNLCMYVPVLELFEISNFR